MIVGTTEAPSLNNEVFGSWKTNNTIYFIHLIFEARYSVSCCHLAPVYRGSAAGDTFVQRGS